MDDWKQECIVLAETKGYSWRKIARILGKSKSSVSDVLRKHFKGYVKPSDLGENGLETIKKGEGVSHYQSAHLNALGAYKGPRILKRDGHKPKKHLIIADTQVKPSSDLSYLKALSNYIAEKQPDVIVHIGDHFDMESLSSYDKGKKSFEGRRVKKDLEAGYAGMDCLTSSFKGILGYNPRMVYCLGNHEERIDRFANDNPEFEGFLGTKLLDVEKYGWEVYPFLKPVAIDGIYYVHYLSNPFNGRPYGGTAMNQLKTIGRSFVVGHKQTLDIAIRPTIDGKMQIGIINGAFYPHDEDYKGYQGNNHFRGVTMLHDVHDGYGDPMMVSLKYLMERYN